MGSRKIEYQVAPFWDFAMKEFTFDKAFEFFSPFVGAGIVPKQIDKFTIEVTMKQNLANTGFMGVHFGGSIYAMCDPFFMFLLIQNLGDEYIIWDKSANIQFLKGGSGTLKAKFQIYEESIDRIKNELLTKRKGTWFFQAAVLNDAGERVAEVEKELYVRRKKLN